MYKLIKRFFDLLFSLIALLFLSPLFLIVMLLLAFTGEHVIFYTQKRMGYRNRIFGIYKFATMLKNSPNMGTGIITLRNDPRVTMAGRILRITKINELPQIFNVLKGDMSMVGPRPLVPQSVNLYPEEVRNTVYNVIPGMTGIGSVVFRDEEKIISAGNDPQEAYRRVYAHKGKLEIWYQQHRSFITDLKILFLTGWLIIFPKSGLYKNFFPNLPASEF